MRFKFLILFLVLGLSSCAQVKSDTAADENILGQKLDSVSGLRTVDGLQAQKVTMFDPTIKKIHQFDLTSMTWLKTLSVLNANEKHYVLDSGNLNYTVDLSLKHISIFDRDSNANHNPVRMMGNPISAAFRPDLGWLVIYDDLQSVAVIKLSNEGQVMDSYVFGAVVDNGRSIVSGDLQDDGSLVLALSDNSVAVVDLQASLNAQPKKWISTLHTTSLSRINWIAPVTNRIGRLLMKTSDQVVLYDLSSRAVLQDLSVDSKDVVKLSKSGDPHVVVTEGSSNMKLIYTDGNTLQSRSIALRDFVYSVLNSDLDLRNDSWTYVYLKNTTGFSWFNDVNQKTEDRQLVRYRISDQLALQSKPIDNKAQIRLSPNFIFALYPSVLGYAKKVSILGEEETSISKFNLKKF